MVLELSAEQRRGCSRPGQASPPHFVCNMAGCGGLGHFHCWYDAINTNVCNSFLILMITRKAISKSAYIILSPTSPMFKAEGQYIKLC